VILGVPFLPFCFVDGRRGEKKKKSTKNSGKRELENLRSLSGEEKKKKKKKKPGRFCVGRVQATQLLFFFLGGERKEKKEKGEEKKTGTGRGERKGGNKKKSYQHCR